MNRKACAAVVAVAGTALAACAPGSSGSGGSTASSQSTERAVKTDAAQLGDVTLTVWDQEVRGGGNAQMTKNVASFQAKYPNIKIKRVSRSFDDLSKTLRLALSGNDAPDIVQAAPATSTACRRSARSSASTSTRTSSPRPASRSPPTGRASSPRWQRSRARARCR